MDYVYVNLNPSLNSLYSNSLCFKFSKILFFRPIFHRPIFHFMHLRPIFRAFAQFPGPSPDLPFLHSRPIIHRPIVVAQFSVAQKSGHGTIHPVDCFSLGILSTGWIVHPVREHSLVDGGKSHSPRWTVDGGWGIVCEHSRWRV